MGPQFLFKWIFWYWNWLFIYWLFGINCFGNIKHKKREAIIKTKIIYNFLEKNKSICKAPLSGLALNRDPCSDKSNKIFAKKGIPNTHNFPKLLRSQSVDLCITKLEHNLIDLIRHTVLFLDGWYETDFNSMTEIRTISI